MLLLRDFFLFAASVLPTSTVAFSLSDVFLFGERAPIDLRVRRVAGSVTSPFGAIVRGHDRLQLCGGCESSMSSHVERVSFREESHVRTTSRGEKYHVVRTLFTCRAAA